MKHLLPLLVLISAFSCLRADDTPSVTLHQPGPFGRFFRAYPVPEGTFFSVVKSAPFQVRDLLDKDMLRLAITAEPPPPNPKWKVSKLAMTAPILAVNPANSIRDISSLDASELLQQKFGSWRTLGGPTARIRLYKKTDAALPIPVIQTCGCHGTECQNPDHKHDEQKAKKQFFSYGKPLLFQTESDNKSFSLLFTDPYGMACFDITRFDEDRVPLLTVDKIPPTLKEFDSGRYPLLTTYYLVEPANPTREEQRVVKYMLSREFARQLYEAGFLPAHVVSAPKQRPPASPMRKPAATPSAPGANLPAVKTPSAPQPSSSAGK